MARLNGIKLVQWNCCGIRSKVPQLQAFAPFFDILCLQETLLWQQNKFWLNGFNIVRKDIISSPDRGICILISNKFDYTVLDLSPFLHTSIEVQGIILKHKYYQDNQPLVIINIYRHPNQFTPPSILDGLLQTVFKNYSKVLISGDFNAHHSWWGCEYEDGAGRMLAHLFDAYNLIPINDGQPTIILSPNSRRSVIDFLVTSSSLAPLCHSYTNQDSVGSDHLPVITHIEGTPPKKRLFKYKLKLSKKDALLFNYKLNVSFDSFVASTSSEIIQYYKENLITSYLRLSIIFEQLPHVIHRLHLHFS